MSKPAPDSLFPEDEPTYVYRVVSTFREALQRLISVKQASAFHLLLEFELLREQNGGSAESTRNGKSRS